MHVVLNKNVMNVGGKLGEHNTMRKYQSEICLMKMFTSDIIDYVVCGDIVQV